MSAKQKLKMANKDGCFRDKVLDLLFKEKMMKL